MRGVSRLGFTVTVLALTTLALTPGYAKQKLDSGYRDRDIEIDGTIAEWDGVMTDLDKVGLAVGVLNDEEFLYVSVSSWEPDVNRQVLMLGLTVRLDPKSGTGEILGLRWSDVPHQDHDPTPQDQERRRPQGPADRDSGEGPPASLLVEPGEFLRVPCEGRGRASGRGAQAFKGLAERAEVADVRFHDFRHTSCPAWSRPAPT